jgi:hypothetical protein
MSVTVNIAARSMLETLARPEKLRSQAEVNNEDFAWRFSSVFI